VLDQHPQRYKMLCSALCVVPAQEELEHGADVLLSCKDDEPAGATSRARGLRYPELGDRHAHSEGEPPGRIFQPTAILRRP
jgi:hypothetical protein